MKSVFDSVLVRIRPSPSLGLAAFFTSAFHQTERKAPAKASEPTTRSGEGRGLWSSEERIGGFLALGILLLITLGDPSGASIIQILAVLAWPFVTLWYATSGRISVVTTFSVIMGFMLRWPGLSGSGDSDVLPDTSEAIATLLHGGNPYNHLYLAEKPMSFIFPYPPGELFLHLPGYLLGGLAGVRATELFAALMIMAIFVWLARRKSPLTALPALALYATLPNLVFLSTDASNDTSTGCVLLLVVLALMWAINRGFAGHSLTIAAILAGVAISTKQTAIFVVLMLAVFLWQRFGRRPALRFTAIAILTFFCLALPFLFMGPGQFIQQMIQQISAHDIVFGWNIWVVAQGLGWAIPKASTTTLFELMAIALVTLLMLKLRYSHLSMAVLAGLAITVTALLTARWTTFAYFAEVAPLVLLLPTLIRQEIIVKARQSRDPQEKIGLFTLDEATLVRYKPL